MTALRWTFDYLGFERPIEFRPILLCCSYLAREVGTSTGANRSVECLAATSLGFAMDLFRRMGCRRARIAGRAAREFCGLVSGPRLAPAHEWSAALRPFILEPSMRSHSTARMATSRLLLRFRARPAHDLACLAALCPSRPEIVRLIGPTTLTRTEFLRSPELRSTSPVDYSCT